MTDPHENAQFSRVTSCDHATTTPDHTRKPAVFPCDPCDQSRDRSRVIVCDLPYRGSHDAITRSHEGRDHTKELIGQTCEGGQAQACSDPARHVDTSGLLAAPLQPLAPVVEDAIVAILASAIVARVRREFASSGGTDHAVDSCANSQPTGSSSEAA